MSQQETPTTTFTGGEISYLRSGRLGRLATVGRDVTPHVTPVGFSYNAGLGTVDVGGRNLETTKKFRDVARSGRAALVVDDVRPPWRPRWTSAADPYPPRAHSLLGHRHRRIPA